MVLIWNALACGSGELAAVLVALNSVFQILTYSVLGWLYLTVVPGWFGADTTTLDISMGQIARSVLIFLGVPLVAGYLTRKILVARKGAAWYDGVFMPKIGPTALLGLLYTIVLMFAMQGHRILELPLDVVRIALPMLAYFGLMFGLAFWLSRADGLRLRDHRLARRSRRPATTSSSPSRWPWPPSASPRARRSRPWWAR